MSDTHGRFIWYELMSPDIAGAKAFYGKVTGWTFEDMPMPGDEGGHPYTIIEVQGLGIGGAMPLTEQFSSQGIPPNWTAYVAVDDVDASTDKAKSLGGALRHGPVDIPGIGRFSVIADPAGAVIAMMTPFPMDTERKQPPRDALGQAAWHELMGADPAQGFGFYETLFGWRKTQGHDMGPMGVYQLFANQDGEVGGMMKKPAEVPVSCWTYYYRVDDINAAARRISDAGGKVMNGPMEVPGGDWIVQASDPAGAVFAVVEVKSGR